MQKHYYQASITGQQWLILGCASLLALSMYSGMLCVPPIEHIIRQTLGISHAQMGIIFAIPLIALVICAIPSGFFADRFGIRAVAGTGSILLAVGGILRGVVAHYSFLVLSTCIFGIGFALIFPNLPKLVGIWFPREKGGVATGIYTMGVSTGAALALAITLPAVYPVLNTYQGVFYLWSIPAIIAAILWWTIVKNSPETVSNNDDSINRSKNINGIYNITGALASVWKNKGLWLVAVMLLFNNIHFYVWSGWLPAMLILKGAQADLAALLTSILGWIGIPATFFISWISQRTGLKKISLWVLTIALSLSSLAMIFIPLSVAWLLITIIGIALSGTFALILSLPLEMESSTYMGIASGTMLSFGYLGGFIGPWMAGYIADVTGTFNLALIVLTAIAILWIFIVFLLPGPNRRAKHD